MRWGVRYLSADGTVRAGIVAENHTGRLELREHGASPAADREPADSPAAESPAPGIVVGALTDWHVHLQLVDTAALTGGVVGRVFDLGGEPGTLTRLAARPPGDLRIEYAGAFFTAPGGYPSDRDWAPAGSFRELENAADARQAVADMAAAGASAVKIASNAEAGPVLSEEIFTATVDAARAAGLPVIAHAEGAGEAMRVLRLGATVLAHTPFSERLSHAELAAHAAQATWISTLDVHGWGEPTTNWEIARDNLAGFHALGGNVRYGTDLGNGPLPLGLNPRELAGLASAGLTPLEQLAAAAPADPTLAGARLVWVPGTGSQLDVAAARPLTASDLTAAVTTRAGSSATRPVDREDL